MTCLLLAPDKFKGSITAAEVVAALTRGIAATAPDAEITACPIADGGDGTVDAALAAGATAQPATVTGPTGEPRETVWALEGTTAVLELADAVGLKALPGGELSPRDASSRGLGELILAAVRAGAREIVVGLGGSASTDAGAGLLQALGARLLTVDGEDIVPGLAGLEALASVDLSPALAALEGASLTAANDVANPLLGADGAAAVYGPQKGLGPEAVTAADRTLAAAASLLDPSGEAARAEGAGAAGGVGFALLLLGATQRSGADVVLELADFDARLEAADLVVTGEGKLDAQTLQGKGPAEVARRAAAAGLPVLAVAGAVTLDQQELASAGIDEAFDLVSRAADVPDAIARGEALLEEVGREMGRALPALLRDSRAASSPLP
ncbi:glycerate kinase [Brachybacterium paraconglomeratum]|uniref:glycerate kinase n=1 Tax=Brachybacterium paraconglomeratum TaxID=173362 RepID=UPI00223AC916|nr:glycerate kinase [Brachybacterium paraconglomeratum]MCT1436913.1 glycerate kinase [Brachybacterium paraconglomeratum]